MKEDDTKTIRITKDAYKILHAKKKELSSMGGVSYSYSDVILAGLAILDALSEEHEAFVLDLLKYFKKARLERKSEKSNINIEQLFKEATKKAGDEISSKLLKDTITEIIQHLIERGYPGAAMSILLSHAHLFDEYERNRLSFEILAAMGDIEEPKFRKNLNKKIKELL